MSDLARWIHARVPEDADLDRPSLASLVVDLRVTQMVNRVRGVHAVLPDAAIRFP